MFHRRLVLLGGLGLCAFSLLGAQLANLTLLGHDEALAEAEVRLTRTSWLPTARGSILDRTGRVLAEDRPGYEFRVEYRVLTGEWAQREGERAARRLHAGSWGDLPEATREAMVAQAVRRFDAHVNAMWDRVAATAGVERAEIEANIADVVERVERMHRRVSDRQFEKLVREQRATGALLSSEEAQRLRALADRPIAEQRRRHAVLSGIDAPRAFELIRLGERSLPLFGPQFIASSGGLAGIPADNPAALERRTPLLPESEVAASAERVHPFQSLEVTLDRSTFPRPIARETPITLTIDDVAMSIVGAVREGVQAEDTQARRELLEARGDLRTRALTPRGTDRGRYRPGDRVGRTGIEGAMEGDLRGMRGTRTVDLRTGERTGLDPSPGRDVRLTIDAALQARVRAIMDPAAGLTTVHDWHDNETLATGTHLYGAAVVLDVQTSEILAMVSTPTVPSDGDWSRLGLVTGEQVDLFTRLFNPQINRAVGKPYPPGSIAKAMVLAGATERGLYTPGERIPATGHLLPDRPDLYRSWIYKMYGITHADQLGRDPDGVDAMMVSANVFFYTLGRRLGPEGIESVYREFGVGEAPGLGIGPEWPGRVGTIDTQQTLGSHDAILMGIGQGPVTWTPLHAANAYASIARGGVFMPPTLVRTGRAPEARELALGSRTVEDLLEGLRLAVTDNNYGTGVSIDFEDGGPRGEIFNVPGVVVYGKTGTATAPSVLIDPDGDGPAERVTALSGDHSWFVVLAGDEGGAPRYAVAVVVDYAGSGGRVSGPVCNQILHALVHEGYLRGEPGDRIERGELTERQP